MKILQTGDWHLNSKSPLFWKQKEAVRDCINLGNGVDAFFITGDLCGLDAPHFLTHQERLFLCETFITMAEIAPVYIVAGNHDDPTEFSLFPLLKSTYPITAAYDSVTSVTMSDGTTLVMAPWLGKASFGTTDTEAACDELVLQINKLKPYRVLGHYPILGAIEGGFIKKHLDEITLLHNKIKSGFIHLGHQHQEQRHYVSETEVHYAGSLFPVTMRETAPKGVLIHTNGRREFREVCSWQNIKHELHQQGDSLTHDLFLATYEDCVVRLDVFYSLDNPPADSELGEIKDSILKRNALSVTIRKVPAIREARTAPYLQTHTTLEEKLHELLSRNINSDGQSPEVVEEAMLIYDSTREEIQRA